MTERQRIFMWVMVGISLFLGVAVMSCLVTFAVLDTRASLELRVQVQELAARLDNRVDTGISSSNLTTAMAAFAARLDNTSTVVEELSTKAGDNARAVLQAKTQNEELRAVIFNQEKELRVQVQELAARLDNRVDTRISASNLTIAVAALAARLDNTSTVVEELSTKAGDNARAVLQVKTKNEELSIRVEKNNLTLSSDVTRLLSGLDGLRAVISNLSSLSLPHCRHYKTLGLPSGAYNIDLHDGLPAFPAFCDMDTEDGPWLVFQRRQDGSVNFTRNWTDYTSGFGHLEKEFWLGLEKLHRLTSARMTHLRVDMATWEGKTGHALYSTFRVANSRDLYRLEVHGYSGNAGDDMYYGNEENSTANGMQFSTYDEDHDTGPASCAQQYKAGWWYNRCHNAHPNGIYGSQGSGGGQYVKWMSFYGNTKKSLKFMEMKIK